MYELQSWYAALENMRFSLPDEDAREKAAGEALPFRIDRFKEAALAVRPEGCSTCLHIIISYHIIFFRSLDCLLSRGSTRCV